ncbi:MAG: hypothetical protein FWF46_04985 [Oscillospiraceae bacterium]|nr:hypothetical protein [Oscillospiraceae bacterium]
METTTNTEKLLTLTTSPNEQNNMEVIVKYNGDIMKLEQELGIEVEILEFNYAIITLRPEQVNNLYNYTEIEYIELPKTVTFSLEQELSSVCLPISQTGEYNVTGKGTIVAIIDSGIDYTHPDFINEDQTSRILFIWDQTGTGIPPSGFKSGIEYTSEQINKALQDIVAGLVPDIPEMDIIRTWNGSCWNCMWQRKSKWWKAKRHCYTVQILL